MSETTSTRAPAISDLSWGSIDTDAGSFRDAKLWPGGGRNWDWNETGTHHSPGVQTDDVEELVDNGAEIVVLGRGQQQRLEVPDATVAWLEERGVEVEVLESSAAVERYNELASDGRAVGALIHTTC
ncbi:MAG: Mth938-like domain-containing protein [Nitriliruptorales bacterium]|nr:Mth938-like domain-containing protein [Nitriliruptorales bacterium]